jgi:hypothetical protein
MRIFSVGGNRSRDSKNGFSPWRIGQFTILWRHGQGLDVGGDFGSGVLLSGVVGRQRWDIPEWTSAVIVE